MQDFRQPDISRQSPPKQQGVALMVMLVIMVVGAATFLVSSLASSAIKIDRDKTTAKALAQAKEALIGRALADGNHPGSLPCPDINDDGSSELLAGNECPNYTGRLPWRTLKLPDLRDGAGERLWYALSRNFRDDDSNHINSDTQGTLNISGTNPANQIIAIVFAPGQVLNGTSRSPVTATACSSLGGAIKAQSLCATNYLEGSNAALSTGAAPNLNYNSGDTGSTFNDRMIFITHKDFMPLIEKRIAREAKGCLDTYASAPVNAGTYPWAAPVSDATHTATTGTLFGRLPAFPGCTLFSSSYWADWADLVFYQIADGYKPGGSGSCGASCLTINGSGNTAGGNGTYHAAVIVAGKTLSGTRTASSIANYLEGAQANRINPPPSTILETYKTSDAQYPTSNDWVLCVDGGVNCK